MSTSPRSRVTEGNRDYSVRVIGEFASVEELRNLKLSFGGKNGAADRTVLLSDIARIDDTVVERTSNASLAERKAGDKNLPPASDTISIAVQKTSDGNTVQGRPKA